MTLRPPKSRIEPRWMTAALAVAAVAIVAACGLVIYLSVLSVLR